jgi:hypothetical protein
LARDALSFVFERAFVAFVRVTFERVVAFAEALLRAALARGFALALPVEALLTGGM